jgi:hypothetical protein
MSSHYFVRFHEFRSKRSRSRKDERNETRSPFLNMR